MSKEDIRYSEEDIVRLLTERFEGITVTIQRERRIWLNSPREGFIDVMTYIHDELGFDSLCTITGVDAGDEFQLIYHLSYEGGAIVINSRVSVPHSDPVFDTATDIYKGGVLYELEARNLLGLTILGIPEDIRYPLPDSWPEGQYPLRKSWVVPTDDADVDDDTADATNTDDIPANTKEADNG